LIESFRIVQIDEAFDGEIANDQGAETRRGEMSLQGQRSVMNETVVIPARRKPCILFFECLRGRTGFNAVVEFVLCNLLKSDICTKLPGKQTKRYNARWGILPRAILSPMVMRDDKW
jgi:hypothetical protein